MYLSFLHEALEKLEIGPLRFLKVYMYNVGQSSCCVFLGEHH